MDFLRKSLRRQWERELSVLRVVSVTLRFFWIVLRVSSASLGVESFSFEAPLSLVEFDW